MPSHEELQAQMLKAIADRIDKYVMDIILKRGQLTLARTMAQAGWRWDYGKRDWVKL